MKPYYIALACIVTIAIGGVMAFFAHAGGLPLLLPSGHIGVAERDMMVRATLLMLIVVIPVFVLIILIGWRYRAKNIHAAYTPEWQSSPMEEFIWWVIPFEIVLVLSALTWSGTHALAPDRAIESTQPALTVQVVALPWKWLFIYPDEGIASVNELTIPAGRPVTFQITSDAPMNSFWIPALGGQMYAMSGMTTELNLIADAPGDYIGRSANYSGDDFAQMTFAVHSLPESDFDAWVVKTKQGGGALTRAAYTDLSVPSAPGPVRYYGSVDITLANILNASMQMDMDSTSSPMMMGMPAMNMPGMDMGDMAMPMTSTQ